MDSLPPPKIGFFGCGNIAKAIGGGLLASGMDPKQIYAYAPSDRSKEDWTKWGTNFCSESVARFIDSVDIVFLCMKPYQFSSAVGQVLTDPIYRQKDLRSSKLYVSTLSGVPLSNLAAEIEKIQTNYRLIRSMPNTPALVRAACTVICPHSGTSKADVDLIQSIFECIGLCYSVPEHLISPAIGVAGSSPAFIYILIEAMADAGVKGGLTREMAQSMSAQAVMGAAKMVLESSESPGKLKDNVCSPGGTTIEGVLALEEKGFRHAIQSAVLASTKKSEEMTKFYSK